MTEASPESVDDAIAQVVRGAIDTSTEQGIAAQGFSWKDGNYREAYNKIHALYEKVVDACEYLQEQGSSLTPEDVSNQIQGIKDGAANAREVLVGQGSESLLYALRSLEAELAKLLNDMHDSYVTYMRTDQESAFDLLRTANAAEAS